MKFFAVLLSMIPLGILGICGYGIRTSMDRERAEYQELKSTAKYQINDIVYFKLDDRKGIITKVRIDTGRKWDIFYTVRVATNQTIGIDTSAGSGFLGSTSHTGPSVYTEVIVRQGELK